MKTCEDKAADAEEEETKTVLKWKATDMTEVAGDTGVLGLIEEETTKALEELAAATVAAIEKAAQEQLAEEMRLAELALIEEQEEEEEEEEENEEELEIIPSQTSMGE